MVLACPFLAIGLSEGRLMTTLGDNSLANLLVLNGGLACWSPIHVFRRGARHACFCTAGGCPRRVSNALCL